MATSGGAPPPRPPPNCAPPPLPAGAQQRLFRPSNAPTAPGPLAPSTSSWSSKPNGPVLRPQGHYRSEPLLGRGSSSGPPRDPRAVMAALTTSQETRGRKQRNPEWQGGSSPTAKKIRRGLAAARMARSPPPLEREAGYAAGPLEGRFGDSMAEETRKEDSDLSGNRAPPPNRSGARPSISGRHPPDPPVPTRISPTSPGTLPVAGAKDGQPPIILSFASGSPHAGPPSRMARMLENLLRERRIAVQSSMAKRPPTWQPVIRMDGARSSETATIGEGIYKHQRLADGFLAASVPYLLRRPARLESEDDTEGREVKNPLESVSGPIPIARVFGHPSPVGLSNGLLGTEDSFWRLVPLAESQNPQVVEDSNESSPKSSTLSEGEILSDTHDSSSTPGDKMRESTSLWGYKKWPSACRFLVVWGCETVSDSAKPQVQSTVQYCRQSKEYKRVFGETAGSVTVHALGIIERKIPPSPVTLITQISAGSNRFLYASLFNVKRAALGEGDEPPVAHSNAKALGHVVAAVIEFDVEKEAKDFYAAGTFFNMAHRYSERLYLRPDFSGIKFWLHFIFSTASNWATASVTGVSAAKDPAQNVFLPFLEDSWIDELPIDLKVQKNEIGLEVRGDELLLQRVTVEPKFVLVFPASQKSAVLTSFDHIQPTDEWNLARIPRYIHRLWTDPADCKAGNPPRCQFAARVGLFVFAPRKSDEFDLVMTPTLGCTLEDFKSCASPFVQKLEDPSAKKDLSPAGAKKRPSTSAKQPPPKQPRPKSSGGSKPTQKPKRN